MYKSRDFPSALSTCFVVKLLNFCQSDKRKFYLKVVSVGISIWVRLSIFYYIRDLREPSGRIPCLCFYWVLAFVCFKINCLFWDTFRGRRTAKIYCFVFLMPSWALLIVLDGLIKSGCPGILGLVIGVWSQRRTKVQLMTPSCLWACSNDRSGRFFWASDEPPLLGHTI